MSALALTTSPQLNPGPTQAGVNSPMNTSPRDPSLQNASPADGGFLNDARLVARSQAGDTKAFELLVARHTRFAGAVAVSVVSDYHAALDVVQESFVKVLRRLDTLEDGARFRPWLRNVVRTTALDSLRRRKVVGRSGEPLPDHDDESQPLPSPNLQPDELLAKAELREQVRDVVGQLPETHREVVTLKYLEGLSYDEIAQATGLTVNTIESRLFRARNKLRTLLVAQFGGIPSESRNDA